MRQNNHSAYGHQSADALGQLQLYPDGAPAPPRYPQPAQYGLPLRTYHYERSPPPARCEGLTPPAQYGRPPLPPYCGQPSPRRVEGPPSRRIEAPLSGYSSRWTPYDRSYSHEHRSAPTAPRRAPHSSHTGAYGRPRTPEFHLPSDFPPLAVAYEQREPYGQRELYNQPGSYGYGESDGHREPYGYPPLAIQGSQEALLVARRAPPPGRAASPAEAEIGDDGGALDWGHLRTTPARSHTRLVQQIVDIFRGGIINPLDDGILHNEDVHWFMGRYVSINDKKFFDLYYKELKTKAVASNQEDTETQVGSQRSPGTQETLSTSSATVRVESITVGTPANPAPATQATFNTSGVPGLPVRSSTSGAVNTGRGGPPTKSSLSTVNNTAQQPPTIPKKLGRPFKNRPIRDMIFKVYVPNETDPATGQYQDISVLGELGTTLKNNFLATCLENDTFKKRYARMTDPTMADSITKGHKCILNHVLSNSSGKNKYKNGPFRACNHCQFAENRMCVHLERLDGTEPVFVMYPKHRPGIASSQVKFWTGRQRKFLVHTGSLTLNP
jgi:hypothetical protein